jgi:hypothetical protein
MVEREVFCLGKQTPPEQPGRSGGMAEADALAMSCEVWLIHAIESWYCVYDLLIIKLYFWISIAVAI